MREIAQVAMVGEGVVRGLVDAGTLLPVTVSADAPFDAPDPGIVGPILCQRLKAVAAEALTKAVRRPCFCPHSAGGRHRLRQNRGLFRGHRRRARGQAAQVLVLLPEIALTSQWLDRFEARFGARPSVWHSDLTQAERRRAWRSVSRGEARVVVGARSALFLPFGTFA